MASWPAALAPGWRRYGRPAALIAAKVWASQRVDLTISLACTAVWPGALGVGISRGVRLLIAARMARSVARGAEEEEEEGSSDDDEDAGPAGSSGSGSSRRRAAEPAGPAGQANGVPASSPAKRSGAPARPHKPAPKGLGGMGLPAMLLPVVPPGALACCSVQPVGLPLMLVGQSAARAPLYAARGDRLVRGLVGLAASFLLCR